jgi:tetratricopeptide (TPR) repeat protein
VLQAQIEIADTYYLEAKYTESADYYMRLLKEPPADLDQAQIEFKLISSLSGMTNYSETIARGEVFLDTHPNSVDVPEVRFLLASAMKKLDRNQDALKQVLLLLQSQRDKNQEVWAYWQRRAGNEIAAQLYKEGDYLDSLQINLSLADLDTSAAWQLPVWYQTALLYEQLQQWQKATDMYQRIVDRQKELTDPATSPSLLSLLEMAKWRKDYITWLEKAHTTDQTYQFNATNRPPAAPVAAQ